MNILLVVGARPQFIKAKMICDRMKEKNISFSILHTGQHYDYEMSESFFKELKLPKPYKNLDIGNCSPGQQLGRIVEQVYLEISIHDFDRVVVFGDTNSTLGASLAVNQTNRTLIHIEAGERCGNRKMREEMNRILVDQMSDVRLCATEESVKRLEIENMDSFYVGDLMYECFLKYQPTPRKNPAPYFVLTLHRQENMERVDEIMQDLGKSPYPIIFPCHPRTKKHLKRVPKQITLIEPQGYLQMLSLIADSKAVFTDSGGLQKESVWLSKPCYTLRKESEWWFMFNWNPIDPNIAEVFKERDWEKPRRKIPDWMFGLTNASEKIFYFIAEKKY
jgi:UDP-N-acetylglucosamine 2-epimerase